MSLSELPLYILNAFFKRKKWIQNSFGYVSGFVVIGDNDNILTSCNQFLQSISAGDPIVYRV